MALLKVHFKKLTQFEALALTLMFQLLFSFYYLFIRDLPMKILVDNGGQKILGSRRGLVLGCRMVS